MTAYDYDRKLFEVNLDRFDWLSSIQWWVTVEGMQDKILQIRNIGFETELSTIEGIQHKREVVKFFLV